MDFRLTEEQEMFRNAIRDFAKRELEPIAERIDQDEEFPFENHQKLADLGVIGLTIPEKYGGSGGTYIHFCIAMEEIARACASTSNTLHAGHFVCHFLNVFGNEEQKQRCLLPLAKGEKQGAFALTEPNSGSDVSRLETTAVKDGNSYIVNGTKIFISNGNVADYVIVFAATDKSLGHRGLSAFIIEKGIPGFSVGSIYHKLGIRGAHTAELLFDDCRVPAENLVGSEGQGFRFAVSALDTARINVAAQAVGIARAALEASIEHTKQRQQYGQPIANFQAIQWMLADIATGIDAARLLTYQAADLADRGCPYTTAAAMAKVFASEVAMAATTKGIQMHGGYGYMLDSPMQRYFRDAKIMEIYEGTSEIMRVIISRSLLG